MQKGNLNRHAIDAEARSACNGQGAGNPLLPRTSAAAGAKTLNARQAQCRLSRCRQRKAHLQQAVQLRGHEDGKRDALLPAQARQVQRVPLPARRGDHQGAAA